MPIVDAQIHTLRAVRLLQSAIAVFVLSACASAPLSRTAFLPPQHFALLEKAPACCPSYRDIRYGKLQRGVETTIAITPESPVFQFDQGRAYFAAFELPGGISRLVVKTYAVNMTWPDGIKDRKR